MAADRDPYTFGPFRLDLDKRLILRDERPINRSRQRFEILKVLMDASGKTVTYNDFVLGVWNNRAITPHGVCRAVLLLKRDLRDYGDCIQREPDNGHFFAKPPTVGDGPEPFSCPLGMDYDAWLSYQVGVQELNRRTEESLRRAVANFETTLVATPNYAPAHLNLAECLVLLSHTGFQLYDPRLTLPQIHKHIKQSITCTSDHRTLAGGRALSGKVKILFFFDLEGAEADFSEALTFDDTYAPIHHGLAHLRLLKGQFASAYQAIQRAHVCDPLSPMILATAGWLRYFAGEYAEGASLLRRALVVHPKFPPGHIMLGMTLEALGQFSAAIDHYKQALELQDLPVSLACLGHIYGKLGRTRDANRCLAKLRGLQSERFINALFFAQVSVGLGNLDEALQHLSQALAEKADWVIYIAADPRWQPLYSDKRFIALLKKVGVYQYWKGRHQIPGRQTPALAS